MTDTMPRVTIAQIQQATAQHFGMTGWQVTGCRNRERTVARARQIAMYLAREMTEASYRQIAKRFGSMLYG
jgi:chromosomal replication initiator protein